MLTSANTVVDRIVGLEMVTDDYVPTPSIRELMARVKSVRAARRRGACRYCAARVRIGRCVLDLGRTIAHDEKGGDVAISPLEF